MATFSKANFDAAAYLARRPQAYSAFLVQTILKYANVSSMASPRVALDLGCGPGQLTALLAETGAFDKVIGLDPSSVMIERAKATQKTASHTEFVVGSAEDLSQFKAGSISLITSAQAAHWFKHEKANNEFARVLRHGGAIAHCGYGEFYMPEHPKVTPIIAKYFRGRLNGYWEGGRIHAEREFDSVPHPAHEGFDQSTFQRIKFNLESSAAYKPDSLLEEVEITEHRPPVLNREWSAQDLLAYLNTASGVHNYNNEHPGNIAEPFIEEIKDAVGGDWQAGKSGSTETVVWPLALILAKKA